MVKEIKIVIVEKDKVYDRLIKNRIDEIYGIVFFPYKEVEILPNIYMIYSVEATEKREKIFKSNTTVNGINIYGTFVIVGKNKNGFESLTNEQVKDVKYIFERKR